MKSKLKYFIFGFLNFRQALSFLFLKQEHISKAQKYLDELKRIHLNGCRIYQVNIIYKLAYTRPHMCIVASMNTINKMKHLRKIALNKLIQMCFCF